MAAADDAGEHRRHRCTPSAVRRGGVGGRGPQRRVMIGLRKAKLVRPSGLGVALQQTMDR
jgi:hypothetical protein